MIHRPLSLRYTVIIRGGAVRKYPDRQEVQ